MDAFRERNRSLLCRDLLGVEREDIRERICREGWGAELLGHQKENGHWGYSFYQPKWTSTHYTLLDLKNLGVPPDNDRIRKTVRMLLQEQKAVDGGINPSSSVTNSDVCINGMFLNYASYFGMEQDDLVSIVDFLLGQAMGDGGFNCRSNRSGAKHSSLHSTISVLEGIGEYFINGYRYRLAELKSAEWTSREFILKHQFFLSDRTGEIIHKDFLRLSYPSRWKYDILRALDQFRLINAPYDPGMESALGVLGKKRMKDNCWPLQSKHPGQTHFEMEKAGKPSRWNTLRALRVLRRYKGK